MNSPSPGGTRRDIPEFSVLEDSAERLVLETRSSRWLAASILFTLGLAFAAAWWLSSSWALFVAAGLFGAGGAYFALARCRWTFDAGRGTVGFNSLLWGSWEARLCSVTELAITTRSNGRAGEQIPVTMLMMKVEGRGKPVRVNASTDFDVIRRQKQRIGDAGYGEWVP
ncbi:MAG: hypothetical protein ACT4QD_00875 [Acidobacteriota bacterium]